MSFVAIRFAALAVSRWRNGAGRKADVAEGDGWTLGFAWLDADAPFSDYAGHDRTITLADGHGFALDFDGRPELRVTDVGAPAGFDGGWPARCRLLDGPCLVLNAMTRRDRQSNAVAVHRGGTIPFDPGGAAALFAVVLSGQARIAVGEAAVQLGTWDSARIPAAATAALASDGRVAIIAIGRG